MLQIGDVVESNGACYHLPAIVIAVEKWCWKAVITRESAGVRWTVKVERRPKLAMAAGNSTTESDSDNTMGGPRNFDPINSD